MRIRRNKKNDETPAILLSPLIDCVFLLLIFFLVTSMFKRWERQIPVTLADPTASVAEEVRSDAVMLGLSVDGRVFREAGRDKVGIIRFAPVADVPALIDDLVRSRGPQTPVELVVEQETPFQTVIDVLDVLEHHGLEKVRSRVRDGKL